MSGAQAPSALFASRVEAGNGFGNASMDKPLKMGTLVNPLVDWNL